jgi:hypothetical protein
MRRSGSYDELSLIDHLASELGVESRRPVRRVQHGGSGSSISALRWGEEEPTLVLLHGGSLNAHSWDALLLLLDVPALALDLPGHGSSSWFPEPLYTPAAVAAAVAPAIAELAPGAAAVVGHSLGSRRSSTTSPAANRGATGFPCDEASFTTHMRAPTAGGRGATTPESIRPEIGGS